MTSNGGAREKDMRKEAIDWLLRLQDDPANGDLKAQFHAWLSEDASRGPVYQRVQRVMGDASDLLSNDIDFTRKAARRSLPRPRNVVASIALMCLCCGGFILADGPMRLHADIMSDVGRPETVTLADGSRIELNANTAIAVDLGADRREITLLRGEAYFHVAADAHRPFVVVAGNGTTTALGTAFDVNRTADGTRVVVTEHTVAVASDGTRDTRKVDQGQQVSYDRHGRLGSVEHIDTATALAWRQGRFAFEERTLSSVVEEIGRYIPGRIVIAQAALGERRISGSVNLASPQETLDGFANAFDIRVTRIGPYLTILSK